MVSFEIAALFLSLYRRMKSAAVPNLTISQFSCSCIVYSSVPKKRTGPNKRTGWNFDKNQISVQGGILIQVLEYKVKTGNFINNKKDFWKYT